MVVDAAIHQTHRPMKDELRKRGIMSCGRSARDPRPTVKLSGLKWSHLQVFGRGLWIVGAAKPRAVDKELGAAIKLMCRYQSSGFTVHQGPHRAEANDSSHPLPLVLNCYKLAKTPLCQGTFVRFLISVTRKTLPS
jgi:hypothetical protein